MKINNEEVSIEDLVTKINPRDNMIKNCGSNIYLSNQQIDILKGYGFIYENYSNVKSLIFALEEYLNNNLEEDNQELENIASQLAEFDYYYNTNK